MIETNALCRMTVPVLGRSPTTPDEILISNSERVERRCLLTRMEVTQERNVIGQAVSDMWRLRMRTDVDPQPGWEVEVLADGELQWHRYTCARVSSKIFTDCILRRVGS